MSEISVIILTFNSAASIARTLESARQVSDDIHIVDSFSSDDTLDICRAFGCRIVQHPFANYADQRNWAIDTLKLAHPWQLHLDADEELEPALIEKLRDGAWADAAFDGFILGRKIVVFGRLLRFGGLAKTWHCRLFRTGMGRCEDRLYDQHFVCTGKTGVIRAFLRDHQEGGLSEWTIRHNRWSDLEAEEVASPGAKSQIVARLDGNPIERKRYAKSVYYRMPLFLRAFGYFLYRYIFLLGFLDGKEGLVFHVLQAFWFRFLVDAKLFERTRQTANPAAQPSQAPRI